MLPIPRRRNDPFSKRSRRAGPVRLPSKMKLVPRHGNAPC
jgi:hypothetical protein